MTKRDSHTEKENDEDWERNADIIAVIAEQKNRVAGRRRLDLQG